MEATLTTLFQVFYYNEDGRAVSGVDGYCLTQEEADTKSARHGGWGGVKPVPAVRFDHGELYVLADDKPVTLLALDETEQIRRQALLKLTKEEKIALGIA